MPVPIPMVRGPFWGWAFDTRCTPPPPTGIRPTVGSSSMTMAPVDTQYDLTPDQIDFRDTIRQMVRERVAPRAAEIDAKSEYPRDIRKLFADHDLFGLPISEEYGGLGTGTLMLNVAIEEIS